MARFLWMRLLDDVEVQALVSTLPGPKQKACCVLLLSAFWWLCIHLVFMDVMQLFIQLYFLALFLFLKTYCENIPRFGVFDSNFFYFCKQMRLWKNSLLNRDLRATLWCMQNAEWVTAGPLLHDRKLRTTNEHSETVKRLFAAHFLTVWQLCCFSLLDRL